MLQSGRDPLIINDTSYHPIACNLIPTQSLGIKSFLGVPIVLSNGTVFGNLCAMDTEPYTFTEKETRFLKTMAIFLVYTIELDIIAHQDQLTGLNNREFITQYINTLPMETEVTILFIDVDGFKSVNDTYGHKDGDSVLIQIAERINECVRSQDILCRYGGDEFVILSQGDDNTQYSQSLSESIINQFGKPFIVKGDEIALSVSIGISIEASKNRNIEQLVEQADHAMYYSKNNGNNRYSYFNKTGE
ncbi:sensor domain-containing diguanylate cyclase [Salipaludibacillus sp. CF4.18]|uniref:sensor domain-containing diguanylate cyclase n=1 Tax=Salipaludibacillus sp. CF4.18 TaxID=3373081 RepID=UPI003EE59F79